MAVTSQELAVRTGRVYVRARGAAAPAAGLVGLFALIAAGLLASVAYFAWSINSNAHIVQHRYARVQANTRLVALAGQTAALARAIARQARPLGPQVAIIRRQTVDINAQVSSIYDHAIAIRGLVYSIDSTAHSIEGQVHGINQLVYRIDRRVSGIHQSILSIDGHTGSVLSDALAIDSTAASIAGGASVIVRDLESTLPATRQIRSGVVKINGELDHAIPPVRAIARRLYEVLVQVGRPTATDPHGYSAPHGKSINGHANAIDCSPLIAGMHCGR